MELNQIRFCAEECQRQQSGEMSVYHMCNTLAQFEHIWCFSHECVQELGRLVEPKKNANGYRNTPIIIGNQVIPADNVMHQMHNLLGDSERMGVNWTAEGWYQEFESIHPFIDGNGRVGAILYNYLKGTLDNPVTPPEFHRPTSRR